LWATQFHPEKSGITGLLILEGFVDAARTPTARSTEERA
jgi:imidazoleglycerol phosphate synthase glutamine amidotransferase subunit HisH